MNKVCKWLRKNLLYIIAILIVLNLISIYILNSYKTINIEPILKRLDNIKLEAEKEKEKSKELLKELENLKKQGETYKQKNENLREKLKSENFNNSFLTQYGLFLDEYSIYNDVMYEKNKQTYLSLSDYHKYLTDYESELEDYQRSIEKELLKPFWTVNFMINPFNKDFGGSFNIYKPITANFMVGGGIGYYNNLFFNISIGGKF